MDEMATWRDVDKALAGLKRGAKLALATHLAMNPSYLNRKLKGGRDLTIRQQAQVRTFFDLQASDGAKPGPIPDAPRRRVPVYGYAAASGGDLVALNPGEVIEWMELPAGLDPKGEVFVVRTVGSSMEPRIFDGEQLIVQRRMPPARGRDAVIEFNDGSGVVKTYMGERNHTVFARQYNPEVERKYEGASVKAIHAVFCRL